MLYRLIYASRALAGPAKALSEQVRRIVSSAQDRNAELGVTGVLCINDHSFVQVLEGSRAAVNRVYAAIARDERHDDVTLLSYEHITERRFAHWSMVELDLKLVNPAVLLRYLPTASFDPMALAPDQLLILIGELSASVAVVGRDAPQRSASAAKKS